MRNEVGGTNNRAMKLAITVAWQDYFGGGHEGNILTVQPSSTNLSQSYRAASHHAGTGTYMLNQRRQSPRRNRK